MVTSFEDTPQRVKTRVVGGEQGTNGFSFGLGGWRGAMNLALEEGGNHGRQRQR